MAWTSPRTWNVGELVTKLIMDIHVRDNLVYLKEKVDIALKLVARQGGSATNWETQGTTTYTPTAVKVQSGVIRIPAITTASGSLFQGNVTITFPEVFTYRPILIAVLNQANTTRNITISGTDIGVDTATIYGVSSSSVSNVDVSWIAIGE